ncbi:hypothetical protein SUGI_0207020 [Cryptomeria japonica]|nr:hypothetical protein SUGI_0207020 [Cryptomeria japonica]
MDSRGQPWDSVLFKHPSTFDTLALDPVRKSEIIADLDAFSKGKEFYQNTGRPGKEAMVSHLRYDVYDLEVTEARTNAELRKLPIKITNKSIINIEDIDCSLNLSDHAKKPCRVEVREYLSSTNHIEKLDPALLRNHLGIEKHELFPKLEHILEDAQMTPADVNEILISPTRALEELFEAFKAANERPPLESSLNREENPIEE